MKASEPSIIDKCPAVILTGGKSRRMGKDKAELIIEGRSLLERTAECLKEYFDPVFISVRDSRDKLPSGCPAITDRFPGSGPMAGLDSAFALTDAQCIFLCAVDLPFMDGKAAYEMTKLLKDNDACVIKRENGHIEPLFAVYSKSCHKTAEELLKAGDNKMSHLLDQCKTVYVTLEDVGADEELLTNVNTPDEFAKALELPFFDKRD